MDMIDMQLRANEKFVDYMEKNIIYTRSSCRLEKSISVSNVFPIFLKNPNEFEIEYITNEYFERLYSIVQIFPSLNYLIKLDWLDNKKYCAFSEKIDYIQYLYNDYIKKNNPVYIKRSILNNDIRSFCTYLSNFVVSDIVVIEVKNWYKIDNYIIKYFNCRREDIIDLDYRFYFITQFFRLFNIVNFDLRRYRGIDVLYNLKELTANEIYTFKEYHNMFISSLNNVKIVDSFVRTKEDIQNLLYIISVFDESQYFMRRKYIVNFITCIEFFLVKKTNSASSKIESQFNLKVRKCCREYNYHIPINELKELYDYRSLIIHGNFSKINEKIKKITDKQWYKDCMQKLRDEYSLTEFNNIEREELIYSRLYEIFNIIYKLYCEKKNKIDLLKNITDSNEIEEFDFNNN